MAAVRRIARWGAIALGLLVLVGAPFALKYGMQNGASSLDPRLLAGVRGCDLGVVRALRGSSRLQCYKAEVNQHFSGNKPMAALRAVNRDRLGSRRFGYACHLLLHPWGRRLSDDVELGEVLVLGDDDTCAGGFVHGMIEQRYASNETVPQATIDRQCNAKTLSALTSCHHAIGHVLMRNTRNDLPTSIERCTEAGDAAFARRCAAGAFMENKLAGEGKDETRATTWFSKDEPLRPCAKVPKGMLETCHAWAGIEVADDKRIEFCEGLAADTRRGCMIVAGAQTPIKGESACMQHHDCWFGIGFGIEKRCKTVRGPGRAACFEGAGYFRALFAPIKDDVSSRQVCKGLKDNDLTACIRGADTRNAPMDFK